LPLSACVSRLMSASCFEVLSSMVRSGFCPCGARPLHSRM